MRHLPEESEEHDKNFNEDILCEMAGFSYGLPKFFRHLGYYAA